MIVCSPLSTLQNIFNVQVSVSSINNVRYFRGFIQNLLNSSNQAGVRSLQYLSCIIVFELVCFYFFENNTAIQDALSQLTKNTQKNLAPVYWHYRKAALTSFFNNELAVQVRLMNFQKDFGYTLFVKFLVEFIGEFFQPLHSSKRKALSSVAAAAGAMSVDESTSYTEREASSKSKKRILSVPFDESHGSQKVSPTAPTKPDECDDNGKPYYVIQTSPTKQKMSPSDAEKTKLDFSVASSKAGGSDSSEQDPDTTPYLYDKVVSTTFVYFIIAERLY